MKHALIPGFLLLASACSGVPFAAAAPAQEAPARTGLTYPDLVGLAESSPIVIEVQPTRAIALEPERAPGVAPGMVRLYVEADTVRLLGSRAPIGAQVKYLVDLPRDAKGKPPRLEKTSQLLFARPVPQRPGELQLVAPDAQFPAADPMLVPAVIAVLQELASENAPPGITGVRESIHVPGNLAGEGETQIFLEAGGAPAAITVRRRPGQPTRWGVSFNELVADVNNPPRRDTLAWYRLACALPASLPRGADLSGNREASQKAAEDYRFVIDELGPCNRTR
ncbi:hypothetical protein [Pseudoblastomonas halimionae]|uniref:Uncharacterized protein n=1 Tax=Alteriqipengyuania halimionae TaxID=1926630 RepID=A0A6I4U6F0_9SPHN|nr:hypothetical protein [Alteriqipengyuania halimionae]MXP10984.1 hypothetical protein [Alteriqipengyuania halimionae]